MLKFKVEGSDIHIIVGFVTWWVNFYSYLIHIQLISMVFQSFNSCLLSDTGWPLNPAKRQKSGEILNRVCSAWQMTVTSVFLLYFLTVRKNVFCHSFVGRQNRYFLKESPYLWWHHRLAKTRFGQSVPAGWHDSSTYALNRKAIFFLFFEEEYCNIIKLAYFCFGGGRGQ